VVRIHSPLLIAFRPFASTTNGLLCLTEIARVQPIILWDVDGTLIRSNGGRVSVSAFLRALQLTGNLPDDLPYPSDAGGKTDQQLALEVLLAAEIAEDHATTLLPAFGDAYFADLNNDHASLRADIRVLPGVPELLARLQALGVTQSVLTGNLEPVARLKLMCADLDQFIAFELGAFGSDHADRTCLVPIVRERVRDRLGPAMAQADVVVVGDTPRDIACARAGAARVVAVATGAYTRADLEAHHPDAVLDNLSDTEAVITCLLGVGAAVQ
jgi:phosphoglycolate phosphatase